MPNTKNQRRAHPDFAPDSQISFGGILVLNDIRVGVSGLQRHPRGHNGRGLHQGRFWVASGGAQLFPPGKAFNASLLDRQTADDVNPDQTP